MLFKIIRAEFRRNFHNSSNILFIAITLIYCLFFLSFSFLNIFYLDFIKAFQSYQETFAFPNSIFSLTSICRGLFFLLIPAITGYLIGSDYQQDTWKMILPRTPQRGILLLGKILNLAIYLLFLSLIIISVIFICSLIGAIWLQTSFIQITDWEFSTDKQAKILETFIFIVWYVSVGVMITIISRSIIVGTFSCFVVYIFCYLIQVNSPEYISIGFAPTHFMNLVPKAKTEVIIYDSLRPNCSILISWSVISFHIFGAFLVSYLVLKKQEFSSK